MEDDTVSGGPDVDTVTYAYSSNPVTVDLAAANATGQGTDALTAIENITGSQGNDTLRGDAQSNVIDGQYGTDTCSGGSGGVDLLVNCP